MTLGELIKALEKAEPGRVVRFGFSMPDSYRGFYDQVAFRPAQNVTVASMLSYAREALGNTYTGYKGGEFTMDEHTDVWIAEYGQSEGDGIGPTLLRYMLGEPRPEGEG